MAASWAVSPQILAAEVMEFGPILSVRQEAAASESQDGEGGV